jgi:hypothetical protein
LKNANKDLTFINNFYSGLGEMEKNGSLASQPVKYNNLYSSRGINNMIFYVTHFTETINPISNMENIYREAWDKLSAKEKEDLEFYVILTLTNNKNSYFYGFSQLYTLDAYEYTYDYVYKKYNHARKIADNKWNPLRWFYGNMKDTNKLAVDRMKPVINSTRKSIQSWIDGIQKNLSSIKSLSSAYTQSCNKLIILGVEPEKGKIIGWNEIYNSLLQINKIKNDDLEIIKKYWTEMQNETGETFESVNDAMSYMIHWARYSEDNNRLALENHWLRDEFDRLSNENNYHKAVDAFITGEINIKTLKEAAEQAFGKNTTSWKSHFENLKNVLLGDLSFYLDCGTDYYTEFYTLGNEYVSLVERTLFNRYKAEYAIREVEWYQIYQEMADKYSEWQNSVEQIIVNGRTDWNNGVKKMEEAHKQWYINFQAEYNRVSDEWTLAYLAGLEDKEKWLEQVNAAANQASSESFLSLIGVEADRMTRAMDTREPFGIRYAVPKAETLMNELLQASGITNSLNAFSSLNQFTGISSPLVKRGMGGVSFWDAAAVKTAASDMARKTNSELAGREARILARNARQTAEDAVRDISLSVDAANKYFREDMDNTFIIQGLWNKRGNNYIKDVVKGSTLFEPVITQKVTVNGYMDYRMEQVSLQTNMDEKYLSDLDSFVIIGLLENVFLEVKAIKGEIFGEENKKSRGKFSIHIGDAPVQKPSDKMGDKKSTMFYDEGKGELGRLMSEFIYWAVIDIKGCSELYLAPWDKRMWNDEGNWFKSPSLRTVGSVAMAVVSAAVLPGAGLAFAAIIGSSSDIVFGALDLSGGYKTFDEVAFNVGKSLAISTVSTYSMGVFGGMKGAGNEIIKQGITDFAVSNVQGTFNKIMTKTLITGAQAFTTGIAATAISGFTYNSEDGIGYSKDIFTSGIKNTLKSSAISMVSTFTTMSMQAANSGLDFNRLKGIETYGKNVMDLNKLAGSIAGQGMSFALGGDFTLNVLNTNLFSGINCGLLELNIGRNGVTMNIGTGGANVSIDNLFSSFKGTQAWDVINKASNYSKNNGYDEGVEIILRAQFGYGEKTEKNQLKDIFKENINLSFVNEEYRGKSEIIDGKKNVFLSGYQKDMSLAEQMVLAIVLGHEAYRDGVVTSNNYLETHTAVKAHTEMAMRMMEKGHNIMYDENLRNDIAAYSMGADYFSNYVFDNYDSSEDFWKLVVNDGVAGFEWDGKLTYDLSVLGLGTVDKMDDAAVMAMWNLGSNMSYNDLLYTVRLFDTLNSQITSLERALNDNTDVKKSADTIIIKNQISDFTNTLLGIQASGLIIKTDTEILNPGDGRHVFASGYGTMTSDYGIRAKTWTDIGKFQWHGDWDLSTYGDFRLVAPMDGSLGLDFNKEGGLKLVTFGENDQIITYSHSDRNSIMNFMDLFSSNGIFINNDGILSGIAQNMVIGVMGNTGTHTTGAHVHLSYQVGGIEKNPALFFDKAMFPQTEYAKLMSGLSHDKNLNTFQLSQNQVQGIYKFLDNNKELSVNDYFMTFGSYSNNKNEFTSIYNNMQPYRVWKQINSANNYNLGMSTLSYYSNNYKF